MRKLIFALLLSIGCATMPPAKGAASGPRRSPMQMAQLLIGLGYGIQMVDADQGVVVSKWKNYTLAGTRIRERVALLRMADQRTVFVYFIAQCADPGRTVRGPPAEFWGNCQGVDQQHIARQHQRVMAALRRFDE